MRAIRDGLGKMGVAVSGEALRLWFNAHKRRSPKTAARKFAVTAAAFAATARRRPKRGSLRAISISQASERGGPPLLDLLHHRVAPRQTLSGGDRAERVRQVLTPPIVLQRV